MLLCVLKNMLCCQKCAHHLYSKKNVRAIVVCEFLMKWLKNIYPEIWRKKCGSHMIFFQIFRKLLKNYFIKNLQTTIALTFLTHIIIVIDGVFGFCRDFNFIAILAKVQLISKCLFGVFNSPKKRTKSIRLEVP